MPGSYVSTVVTPSALVAWVRKILRVSVRISPTKGQGRNPSGALLLGDAMSSRFLPPHRSGSGNIRGSNEERKHDSGGPRIPSDVFRVIFRILDPGMPPEPLRRS